MNRSSVIVRCGVLLSVLTWIVLSSCHGESPTSQGPSVPDIRGTYTSSGFVTIKVTQVANGQVVTLRCPGSLTVGSQVGARFTGGSIWGPGGDCSTPTSFDVTGEVTSGGGIAFGTARTGGTGGDWSGVLGCRIVTADPNMNGSVASRRMIASSRALVDCTTTGRLQLDLTLDGSR